VEGGVGVGGSVAVPGLTTKKDEAARAARGRSLLSPLFASHSPSGPGPGPIVYQLMMEPNPFRTGHADAAMKSPFERLTRLLSSVSRVKGHTHALLLSGGRVESAGVH
jgi:hypothetical protein